MPELPEVEVSRLGIAPHLEGEQIATVVVRDRRLRWPIPAEVEQLAGRVSTKSSDVPNTLLFTPIKVT